MATKTSPPTAAEIVALYRAGKLSPVEVAQDCFKQLLKYNPVLNAVCFLDEQAMMHQARASEKRWHKGEPRGTLDGVPVTVKDWFDVKGWPTRYGSKTTSDLRQPADSPAAARLREDGAILFAKTTLPEFGHKGVTDSPLCGITRNPWNPAKTPGGSSGGAAVAAVTGMAPLNLGSDAGGSIRIPAGFSGAVGFKPSPGLVPSWPPSVFASLSSLGPLTRSVEDAALMLDVITRPDARDWNALPLPAPRFIEALRKPLPKLRIAWAPSINGVTAWKDARAVFDEKINALSCLGPVDEIALKCPTMVETFLAHWTAIASAHVSRLSAAQRKLLDPHYFVWSRMGDALSLRDYLDAEKDRMHIGAYFKGLLDSYDILATPTTPMTAFDAGLDMPNDPRGRAMTGIWTHFTLPANLAKLPAVTLPLGLTKEGMPVGIQLMSGYLRDAQLIRAAKRLEEEIGFEGWLARN